MREKKNEEYMENWKQTERNKKYYPNEKQSVCVAVA